MKNINQIALALLGTGLLLAGCEEALNVPPQNILQNETVFSNESAVEAYMTSLYNDLPIEDFNFWARNGFNQFGSNTVLSHLTDESKINQGNDQISIGDGTWINWWNYGAVRNVNGFLANIDQASFPENKKNSWKGEALFIRAYYYSGLVKRYGGVPLLTTVQDFTGSNLAELQVPRNTEKEVYDFIATELDKAIALLPETNTLGRVNKYAAYALKSRAMLHAASIAKYGTVSLNGSVGISATEATKYWQLSLDASAALINSKKYTLYKKSADKTKNYQDLFLDQDNPEVVLFKLFKFPEKAHNYDLWFLPPEVRSPNGFGGFMSPTLELVESYEYIDGTDGKLKLQDAQGKDIEYASPLDLFKDKDPRLAATMILPFGDWRGTEIDVQAGIIDEGKVIRSGDQNALYKGLRIIGVNGLGGGVERTMTGFYIRKFLNPSYARSDVQWTSSTQPFIEFRLGEILLNQAEAAVELGKAGDALTAINQIRERAGIRQLTTTELTLEKVRHERQIEMAFEGNRYWDLRRWRIADKMMNNTQFSALEPYYVMGHNTYVFKRGVAGYPKSFPTYLYYERIDPAELSRNPKLVQNPNY